MGSEPTPTGDANSFLASGEDLRLDWVGKLVEGEEEYPAEFVATDNRLIMSVGGGHFKDIGYKHIESVEVGTDVETDVEGLDPDNLIVMGVIAAVVGLVAMGVGGFSLGSVLFGGGLIALGGYGVLHAKENYEDLKDSVEITEYEVFHILLRTSATSPFSMPIYIETTENIGPNLSRLVQEAG